jgi:hypothetical protein
MGDYLGLSEWLLIIRRKRLRASSPWKEAVRTGTRGILLASPMEERARSQGLQPWNPEKASDRFPRS